MLRSRITPCLLVHKKGLVKTVEFDNPKYVGDPINAIRIFNEKCVDELILLDILSTVEGKAIKLDVIRDIASECFMPLCYGGGIRDLDTIREVLSIGVEKVSINSAAVIQPKLINDAALFFGSSTIVVSIDVKKSLLGSYSVYINNGKEKTKYNPVDWAKKVESLGAGEILLNSIDKDGTQEGYDISLLKQVTSAVNIPVVAAGGAGSMNDFSKAINEANVAAVAAGSFFVFHGKHRAVLISYPNENELDQLFVK